MTYPLELTSQRLVTLPRASLAALRSALVRDAGAGYATYLQEAGYAGGESVFDAFGEWLAARGGGAPDILPVAAFATQAAAFFADTGWGSLTVSPVHDVAARLDSSDWAEADPDARLDHPACHFTAGLLADFLGRVANSTLAVLEVECRSSGASRCRFVAGSPTVMQHVYDRMAAGTHYTAALDELA
jgi:predicted hydrocarbon binding protein